MTMLFRSTRDFEAGGDCGGVELNPVVLKLSSAHVSVCVYVCVCVCVCAHTVLWQAMKLSLHAHGVELQKSLRLSLHSRCLYLF